MAQTSTKRRNIIIASIVIVVLVISSIIALVGYNQLTTTRINLSLSTNQTDVIQGTNSKIQIEVTSNGKAENITLSCNVGLSSINCTFEPSIGISNFSSTLTVNVPDSTATGNYSLTVTASSDGKIETATYFVSVISANVTVSGTVEAGNFAAFNVSLNQIQFVDIQTGATTTAGFQSSYSPTPITSRGTYSAILQNEHTYHASVSVSFGPSGRFTFDCGNVYVYAPPGNRTMQQDYPNLAF